MMFSKTGLTCSRALLLGASGLALGAAFAPGASAQEVAAESEAADEAGLGEIIVTATRREARLQDIPMSINAFGSDQLEERGVESVHDMQFLAAGLQIDNSVGITRITIRGIGNNQVNEGSESGVAVHRDGVFLSERPEQGTSFFDVERIEILRGPQGTLYGRNATGGSVNIITKAPTRYFEAGGSLTYGNYDLVETEGYASGPLIGDELMARFAFKTRTHDGFTPNIFDGRRLDNGDLASVRGKLRYEPTSSFRLDLVADYNRDDSVRGFVAERNSTGQPLAHELGADGVLGTPDDGILPSGRAVNYNDENLNEREWWGLSAKAEWDLGGVTLGSTTAYRKAHYSQSSDLDGGDLSRLLSEALTYDAEQISQEITLSSSGDAELQWVLGAYYFHADRSLILPIPLPPLGTTLLGEVDDLPIDTYAVFGEANYPVLDRLTLTIGARYNYERKSIDQSSTIFGVTSSEQLEDSWNSFTPKAALTYEFSDAVTAYATVGKGFKAGGFNTGTLQGRSFEPEKVTNYEVGLKSLLLDGRLRSSISLFHMDYRNLQVEVRRDNGQGAVLLSIDNAATATIRGIELEIEARPTEHLSLDGNVSYLDAKFDRWPDAINNLQGNAPVDVSGNRLPSSPKWAANLGVSYAIPIGIWGSATLRGEYSYKSRTFFRPFEEMDLSQEPFGLFNARLTFEDADGRWSIASWIKNLTDEVAAAGMTQFGSSLSGRPRAVILHPPRTYGVTVGYRF